MKTPLTKKKIQHHLSYSLWKYVLLAVIAAFGWNIVFSVTRYHPPEEKKVVLGVYAFGSDSNINTYMEQVRVDLMPDMEEMNAMFIMPDEAQGAMILTTRIAARDCDIYILPRAQFQSYASTGAFMPLDIVLPDLLTELEAEGVSLSRGYRTLEDKAPAPWNESTASGEKHQYAIPCADLPGMSAMLQCDASDMYIGIFFETGNDDNVCKFFSQFVRDMLQEPVTIELPAEQGGPMLHHILVKWTDEVSEKAALAAEVERLFQGVLTVNGVCGVTVHPNVINRPNRYDLLIRIDMDESALPAYDDCPTHHRWKDEYGHLVAKKAIFDCD